MNKEDYECFIECYERVKELSKDKTLYKVLNNNEKIICKKTKIQQSSHHQISQLKQTLSRQKQLYHDHLLPVIDYYFKQSDQIYIFTQFYKHSLKEELSSRVKKQNYFETEELQNILVSIVNVLKYLESQSIAHACISLQDIYISQSGLIKLIDPSMASNSPFHFKQPYYYSPQLLSKKENINFFENDIFVLGMNILELGLLKPMKNCYSYSKKRVHENYVEEYLLQFEERYGSLFTDLLSQMLNFNPESRLTLSDIIINIQKWFDCSQNYEEDQLAQYFDNNSQSKQSQKNLTVGSFFLDDKSSSYKQSVSNDDQFLFISNPLLNKNKQNVKTLRNF